MTTTTTMLNRVAAVRRRRLDLPDGRSILRRPFGHESPDVRVWGSSCPLCGTRRGDYHDDGCVAEQCPACAGYLTTCSCKGVAGDPLGRDAATARGASPTKRIAETAVSQGVDGG